MKILNFLKKNVPLIIILIVGSILRFYHIDFQSPWLDEVLTLKETSPEMPFNEFINQVLLREGMPHFYFFLLRLLNNIFIYSSYTARMFSAIIGVLSIYSIYVLGKTIYNKNVGLTATVLLAINWFAILYSQEARPYNLLLLFTIISFTRLVCLIKKPSNKNAVLFGIFIGLVVNAHMIGLLTIFSQYLILLFIYIITKKDQKRSLFKYGLVTFITFIIVALPTYKMFLKVTAYKSGWLTLPGADGFTIIFHDFFGKTELLYVIFSSMIIFFIFKLFNEKNVKLNNNEILNNNIIFSSIVLFTWMFFSILLPIIKSYTSEPMITTRYFIAILPALLISISIGIQLIKNDISKALLIACIVAFSLTDLFLVKDYYNTITKAQFREVSNFVVEKNKNKDKIVSAYGWIISYFFGHDKSIGTIELPLSEHINLMLTDPKAKDSFWYFDGNYRPFNVNDQERLFLEQNFILDYSIEKYDCWARHYRLKNEKPNKIELTTSLSHKEFTPYTADNQGNLLIFQNSTISSKLLILEEGKYEFKLEANSLPEIPIDNQNAHVVVKLNEKKIGEGFLSEKTQNKSKTYTFTISDKTPKIISISFDNDLSKDGLDRNVIIYFIQLKKIGS